MVALHILQAAIVYVNTLMVQEVLARPEWEGEFYSNFSGPSPGPGVVRSG